MNVFLPTACGQLLQHQLVPCQSRVGTDDGALGQESTHGHVKGHDEGAAEVSESLLHGHSLGTCIPEEGAEADAIGEQAGLINVVRQIE